MRIQLQDQRRVSAGAACADYSRIVLAKADPLGLHPRGAQLSAMNSVKAVVEADDGTLELKVVDWSRCLVRAGTDERWTPAGIDGLDAEIAAYRAERRRELATLLGLGADASEQALVAKADEATTVFSCTLTCKMDGLRSGDLLDHRCKLVGHPIPLPASDQPLHKAFKVDTAAQRTIERILTNACIASDERTHSKLEALGHKFILTGVRPGWVNPDAAKDPFAARHDRMQLYKRLAWAGIVRLALLSSDDRPAVGSLQRE